MLSSLRPVGWEIPRAWWYFGVAAMMIYAVLRLPLPHIGEHAGTALALSGLVLLLVYGKSFRRSFPLLLLVAALVVQLLTWTLGYFHHPEWLSANPKLDRLAKLFTFIAVAWWLGGSTRNTLLFWGLALSGVLIATLLPGAINHWSLGLSGYRVDFNIYNAQHTSMFLGTGLIGLLAFCRFCLAEGRWVWLRRTGWLAGFILCLVGSIITQTRASWLALVIVLPLMGVAWGAWKLRTEGKLAFSRRLALLTLVGAVISIGIMFALQEPIAKRLGAENEVIVKVVEGDFENIPYSSIGIRIISWRAAADWIADRPLVGWGEEARSLVMRQTDWLPEELQQFGHLHNSFIELQVSYGLLGFAVFIALAWWVARGTWRAWQRGSMPGEMALFGYAFFLFWMIVNSFESFMFFWTGVYLFNVIMGGLVTHIWLAEQAEYGKQPLEMSRDSG